MTADALSFLRLIAPSFGPELLQLSAISPEGSIVAECFGPDAHDAQSAFLRRHADKNLYYGLNPLRQLPANGKASKADVGHLVHLGVDFDPASPATEEEDMAAARAKLAAFPLQPTGIVSTGRGLQPIWLLNAGVHVNGNLAELERYTQALARHFDADSAFDLCRLFRLPGTTNYLSQSKRKKGWVHPAPARLLEWHPDRRYMLSQFCFLVKRDAQPQVARKDASRSAQLLKLVGKDVRAGLADDDIVARHIDHPHAAERSDPERAVRRCIERVQEAATAAIDDMNRRHAIVRVGGNCVVMWTEREWENGLPELSSVTAVRTWYQNAANKGLVDEWLASPDRQQYSRIRFEPGVQITEDFNLWRGWPVQPARGDCSLALAHIRDLICGGNDDLYEYVRQWLANIFQKPREKPGTALVMYSGQGTGKGELYRQLEPLLRPHAIQLAGSELLLGRFNDFLAGNLLVFADEAAWHGDKRGLQKLKSYITEEQVTIERKMIPAFPVANHCRFIIATNREQAAPAELDDRRFVVLPVSGQRRDDFSYWQALADERASGGSAALLHHLLHDVQLTRNLRAIPATPALAEQKLLNLDDVGAFWRFMLMREEHALEEGAGTALKTFYWRWGAAVQIDTAQKFYLRYCTRQRLAHPKSEDGLGAALKKYCPVLQHKEPNAGQRRALALPKEKRYVGYVWVLPPLEEGRNHFAKALRQPVDWPEDWDESTDL